MAQRWLRPETDWEHWHGTARPSTWFRDTSIGEMTLAGGERTDIFVPSDASRGGLLLPFLRGTLMTSVFTGLAIWVVIDAHYGILVEALLLAMGSLASTVTATQVVRNQRLSQGKIPLMRLGTTSEGTPCAQVQVALGTRTLNLERGRTVTVTVVRRMSPADSSNLWSREPEAVVMFSFGASEFGRVSFPSGVDIAGWEAWAAAVERKWTATHLETVTVREGL